MNSQPSTIDYQPPPVRSPVVRKWPRRLLWLAAFCFLLSAFCFAFRSPLLTGLANAWIVNEPLTNADAIVILGGGVESRPFEAARLYHQGLAPRILFMDVKLSPTAKLGLTQPEADLTRRVLLKQEIPESALTTIGSQVANTHDEALALRAWVERTGAKRVILATDLFHSRRVRWLFRKELKSTGAQTLVAAFATDQYQATNWWQREVGLIAFQNEVLKSSYYHLKY